MECLTGINSAANPMSIICDTRKQPAARITAKRAADVRLRVFSRQLA